MSGLAASRRADRPDGDVRCCDRCSRTRCTSQQGRQSDRCAAAPAGHHGSTFAPGPAARSSAASTTTASACRRTASAATMSRRLSEDHAVPIDPIAAERIEVVRGPATLRYGSQAIGGVVNATNERIPEFMPRGGVSARDPGRRQSSVDRGRDGGFQVHRRRRQLRRRMPMASSATPRTTARRRGAQGNTFVEAEGHALGGSFVGRDGFVGVSLSRYREPLRHPRRRAGGEAHAHRSWSRQAAVARRMAPAQRSASRPIRYWFGTLGLRP